MVRNIFKEKFGKQAILVAVLVFAALFIFGATDLSRVFAFVQFESEPISRNWIAHPCSGQHDQVFTGPIGYKCKAMQRSGTGEMNGITLWDPDGKLIYTQIHPSGGPIDGGWISVDGSQSGEAAPPSDVLFKLQVRSGQPQPYSQVNLFNNHFTTLVDTNIIITDYYYTDSINDFKVNVYIPPGMYASGTESVQARIWFWVTSITGVTGEDKVVFVWKDDDNVVGKVVNLEIGKNNEFIFTLPENLVVGEYTAKAVPIVATPGQSIHWSGNNFAIDDVATRRFLINPATIYERVQPGEPCKPGYVYQTDTLCVRSDLSDLSCVQLGCPVTADYTYSCNTALGLCSEEIYQAKGCKSDSDCESGQVCDVNSGVCFNKVVVTEVVQCIESTDCASPCSGVTATCSSDNRCEYSGTCDIQTDIIQCTQAIDCKAPCQGITTTCSLDNRCVYDGTCDVFESILQCQTASDCGVPCAGVTITCSSDDRCVYGGECEPIIEYELVDCNNVGCDEWFTCNTERGTCERESTKTIIELLTEEIVLQCQTASDCGVPCAGVTITCSSDDRCVYGGKCEPVIEYELVDCNNVGCDEGFTCNTERGTCERESTKTIIELVDSGATLREIEPIDTTTTKQILPKNPRSTKKPMGMGTAVLTAIVAGVIWYLIRKRRII